MGAKIKHTIDAVEFENEYGPGNYEYEPVKVEFNSVSDILSLEQNGKQVVLCLQQLEELKELISKIS